MANGAPTGQPAVGVGPPTGVDLPPPALPGSGPQPADSGKPPGWNRIYSYLWFSFLAKIDPLTQTPEKADQVAHACEIYADRTMADFQRYGSALNIPSPDWSNLPKTK